jgi:hypothetical protein
MLESLPPLTTGRAYSLGLLFVLIGLVVSLFLLIITEAINFMTILWVLLLLATLPAIFVVAFWRSNLSNSRYRVEDLILKIEWGRIGFSIPLEQIQYLAKRETSHGFEAFRGIRWPGFNTGTGQLVTDQSVTDAYILSTTPSERQLLVATEDIAFIISPADPDDFITCIDALHSPDVDHPRTMESEFPYVPESSFFKDRISQVMIAAAIILNLALFGFLAAMMGQLQSDTPLHFDVSGAVDRTGSPGNLLLLPIIGLIAWSLSLAIGGYYYFLKEEVSFAQIIWGTTDAIEIATWLAVIFLLIK